MAVLIEELDGNEQTLFTEPLEVDSKSASRLPTELSHAQDEIRALRQQLWSSQKIIISLESRLNELAPPF